MQIEPTSLRILYGLFTLNLGRLLRLLQRYHDTTGHHPDILFRLANGQPKTRLHAELNKLQRSLETEAASTYPTTKTRSPRYWFIYNHIVNHIHQTGVSPTESQIKRACHITSNHVVEHWLDKLEQDGRIVRRPGPARTIHLPDDDPSSPIHSKLPFE